MKAPKFLLEMINHYKVTNTPDRYVIYNLQKYNFEGTRVRSWCTGMMYHLRKFNDKETDEQILKKFYKAFIEEYFPPNCLYLMRLNLTSIKIADPPKYLAQLQYQFI